MQNDFYVFTKKFLKNGTEKGHKAKTQLNQAIEAWITHFTSRGKIFVKQ